MRHGRPLPATVYVGGRVLAGDDVATPAEALVVRAGPVAGAGPRDEMVKLARPGAELFRVCGATILPGLIDTHPHLMHFAVFAEPLVDIGDARSHDDIVERIRARAAVTPDTGRPALFDDFIGTTGLSDFPRSFISGVRPLAFPLRPAAPSATGDHGTSRFSCMEIRHMPGVYDRAGPARRSR